MGIIGGRFLCANLLNVSTLCLSEAYCASDNSTDEGFAVRLQDKTCLAEPVQVVQDHVYNDVLLTQTLSGNGVREHPLDVLAAHHNEIHCFASLELLLHPLSVLSSIEGAAFGDEEVVDTDDGNVGFAGACVGSTTSASKDAPFAPRAVGPMNLTMLFDFTL